MEHKNILYDNIFTLHSSFVLLVLIYKLDFFRGKSQDFQPKPLFFRYIFQEVKFSDFSLIAGHPALTLGLRVMFPRPSMQLLLSFFIRKEIYS